MLKPNELIGIAWLAVNQAKNPTPAGYYRESDRVNSDLLYMMRLQKKTPTYTQMGMAYKLGIIRMVGGFLGPTSRRGEQW